MAPYACCAVLYAAFIVGYLAAVLRYLCAGTAGQEAMERLILTSATAVVSILTLRDCAGGPPRKELPTPRSRR
jgi:hypothetical protein